MPENSRLKPFGTLRSSKRVFVITPLTHICINSVLKQFNFFFVQFPIST